MKTFKRLPDSDLVELQSLGFFHATGLSTWRSHGSSQKEEIVGADHFLYGSWFCNNGVTQIVTEDGQVWLGGHNPQTWQRVLDLVKRICPQGEQSKLFVHCSNGESIHTSYILRRFADPYEDAQMTVKRLFASSVRIPVG